MAEKIVCMKTFATLRSKKDDSIGMKEVSIIYIQMEDRSITVDYYSHIANTESIFTYSS